jgi:hypothetical protein
MGKKGKHRDIPPTFSLVQRIRIELFPSITPLQEVVFSKVMTS